MRNSVLVTHGSEELTMRFKSHCSIYKSHLGSFDSTFSYVLHLTEGKGGRLCELHMNSDKSVA